MTTQQAVLLLPMGKVILPAGFSIALIQAMRGHHDLITPFERLVVGATSLAFFQGAADGLLSISDQLVESIQRLGTQEDLRAILLTALKKAAASSPNGHISRLNSANVLAQVWQTGVWGLMSAVVEGVFLLSFFILECARDVLWSLVLFLLPLAAGLYPVFPRMLTNIALYAIELALWLPMLCMVERVAAFVARRHATQDQSLYVIGVEVVAVLLIAMIPSICHRFMSGAFSGDMGAQDGVLSWFKRAVGSVTVLPKVLR